jgi:hypothetical protein
VLGETVLAVAILVLLGGIRILDAMPVDSSRSSYLLVSKNHHHSRLSRTRHGRTAVKCMSFPFFPFV